MWSGVVWFVWVVVTLGEAYVCLCSPGHSCTERIWGPEDPKVGLRSEKKSGLSAFEGFWKMESIKIWSEINKSKHTNRFPLRWPIIYKKIGVLWCVFICSLVICSANGAHVHLIALSLHFQGEYHFTTKNIYYNTFHDNAHNNQLHCGEITSP